MDKLVRHNTKEANSLSCSLLLMRQHFYVGVSSVEIIGNREERIREHPGDVTEVSLLMAQLKGRLQALQI